jgi:hypothetical protein
MLTSAAVMKLAVLFLALLLSGCTAMGPAAEQFYPAHSATLERVPVILIPGLLGSRLFEKDGVDSGPAQASS